MSQKSVPVSRGKKLFLSAKVTKFWRVKAFSTVGSILAGLFAQDRRVGIINVAIRKLFRS